MASSATQTVGAIEIRPTTPEDAEAINGLLADLAMTLGAAESYRGTADDIRRHGFGDRPGFRSLIAVTDGEPVGLVLFFHTYSSWRGRLGVYVQDLHVVEDHRGSGLGRRLLAAAARQGHADGCTHLRLSVDPDNARAVAFYRRMGLKRKLDEAIHEASGSAFRDFRETGP